MPDSRALDDGIVVHNGLTSTSTAYALSANMGRVLNEKILALDERVQVLEDGAGSGSGSGSGSDNTITLTPATDAEIDALFT